MLSKVWLRYQRDSGSRRQVQSRSPPSTALQYEINPLHCMSCLFLGGWVAEGAELQPAANIAKKRVTAEKSHEQSAGCIKANDVGKARLCRSVGATGGAETNARDGQKKLRARREREKERKKRRGNLRFIFPSFHVRTVFRVVTAPLQL